MRMKQCPQCGRIYKETDFYCLNDNHLLLYYSEEQVIQDKELLYQQNIEQINVPKCPTCQSTNIQKISTASKAAGAFIFGIFSSTARSQFKCNNCGYKW